MENPTAPVIGADIGGIATAAWLARRGFGNNKQGE
jgi:phytoene dehydrogenase-like protein